MTPLLNVNATPLDVLQANSQMLVTIALLTPDSRHDIVLNSSDPFNLPPNMVLPEGWDNYLSQRDIDKLVWGVNKVREIISLEPLSQLTGVEVSPGETLVGDTLRDWVNNNVYANSHWVGTSRMGEDQNSVVDPFLRVRGVTRLRVADASIIPFIPNGNVHSTVIVIASMAAAFILNQENQE